MATWLVTGGCGFIGSHLADALVARGDRVRIVDDLSSGRRANAPAAAEIVVGDVADLDLVASAMAGVDGCFHLAAIASVQRANEAWLATHRANLTGAITIFEAARRARDGGPVPVVYASSAAVYGASPTMPLRESADARPLSAYAADKLGAELHAFVAGHVHGVPTVGFRFFNVYGPRQDPNSPYSGVIAIFAERLKQGRGVTIFGDGHQVRDFVFVADVVAYLLASVAKCATAAPVYNVCTGQPTSVLELARTLAELAEVALEIDHQPARAGDPRTSIGDPARLVDAFGRAPATALKDGLRQVLAAAD